mmetsp:Transcript_17415/g.22018  ORF Transcript_17415/g.22018 Transcript_17415/m.22018 type:complete len:142 (-) Transcript_17415:532-957(-)
MSKNPLMAVHSYFCDAEIFAADKYYCANSRVCRDYLRKIIDDRKKQGIDADAEDVLSLLLQDENYQETEDLIDDIIFLYIAGSKTVQSTTSNTITSLLHEPEVRQRLLAEVDPFMSGVQGDIMEKMTITDVDALEYVKQVY